MPHANVRPDHSPAMDLSWDRKFKPRTIAEMALSAENRRRFERYVAEGVFPHLLLHGPPGVGKTTAAEVLIASIDCSARTLNASKDRGIDLIRSDLLLFLRGYSLLGKRWKVVFLDEADGLARTAEDALRNPMEAYADTSRFILTANAVDRVSDAIRSRCVEIEMGEVPVEERRRVLARVLELEAVEVPDSQIRWFAARYTDLRQMLLAAQQSIQVHGELRLEVQSHSTCRLVSEIIAGRGYTREVPWGLKPYTARGRFTLLSAWPGDGKSTLLAHYVAKKVVGGQFLGQQLEAGAVLWVSGPEENEDDIARRFQELGVADEQIWVETALSDVHAIAAEAFEKDACLVVMDTLVRVAGVRSENDAAEWVAWSNEALPLVHDSGMEWVATHHTRKTGGARGLGTRGSSQIPGFVDIALSLSLGPACNQRILKIDKNRYEQAEDLPLELVDGEYRVADFATIGPGVSDTIPVRERQVHGVLDDDPATCPEIAARLSAQGIEIPEVSLYSYLNTLTSEGRAVSDGRGRKGDPRRWKASADSFDSSDTLRHQTKRNESTPDVTSNLSHSAEEPSGD